MDLRKIATQRKCERNNLNDAHTITLSEGRKPWI